MGQSKVAEAVAIWNPGGETKAGGLAIWRYGYETIRQSWSHEILLAVMMILSFSALEHPLFYSGPSYVVVS